MADEYHCAEILVRCEFGVEYVNYPGPVALIVTMSHELVTQPHYLPDQSRRSHSISRKNGPVLVGLRT